MEKPYRPRVRKNVQAGGTANAKVLRQQRATMVRGLGGEVEAGRGQVKRPMQESGFSLKGNKVPQSRWPKTTEIYCLPDLEAKSLKLRALRKKPSLPLSFQCRQRALASLGLRTHRSTHHSPLALSALCSFPSLTRHLSRMILRSLP